VGALTVCVWLYLVLKSANTGIIGAYGHGYWLLVNIDLGLFTCSGSSVAQHSIRLDLVVETNNRLAQPNSPMYMLVCGLVI
jgi:hypothetical protein